MKNQLAYSLAAMVVLSVMFYLGFRLGQHDKEAEAKVIFANTMGEHIQEVNALFALLELQPKSKVLQAYNTRMLIAIGCSDWVHDLKPLKVPLFLEGVTTAKKALKEEDYKRCSEGLSNLTSKG